MILCFLRNAFVNCTYNLNPTQLASYIANFININCQIVVSICYNLGMHNIKL